jgi:hypothetical protein
MNELDLMRMTFVVGIVIASLIYQRTRLVSGGLMTGAYLALLISSGGVADVIGWAILSVISLLVVKTVSYLVALPKAWLLMIAIVTSAVLHGAFVLLSGGKGGHEPVYLGAFEVIIAGGMYLTPGLTAYDLARQGWLRTTGVLVFVTGASLIVTYSVAAIGNLGGPQMPLTNPVSAVYTDLSYPIVMMVCIATAEAVRLAFGWGSGGIIGAVFFIELLSIESFIVIIVLVAITVLVKKWLERYFTMTPRQWFQFTMILGSLIAWVGLTVGTGLGIEVAAHVNAYALEPLLAVGLISSDVARYGTAKTIYGKLVVLAAVAITNVMVLQGGADAWRGVTLVVIVVFGLYFVGFMKVLKGWAHARKVGQQNPLLLPLP